MADLRILTHIANAFRKRPPRTLADGEFGILTESNKNWWMVVCPEFWGVASVKLEIQAGERGPTEAQRKMFRVLRANPDRICERIEEAITRHAAEYPKMLQQGVPGKLTLSTIMLRSPEERWTAFYDMEGEDIMWFGADVTGTAVISPFADD